MSTLTIIVVGGDIFKITEVIFSDHRLTHANPINQGHLGNFKIRIHIFDLDMETAIETRKRVLDDLSRNGIQILFFYGDLGTVMAFSRAVMPRYSREK